MSATSTTEEPVTFKSWYEHGQHYVHRGHPVFYQTGGRGGAGPVLLLLHGSPTSSWDWHLQWPALCRQFARVVAADMIGFGYSAKPRDYDYTIADQADLQQGLLASLGVERCHVIGHGYGDTVAQELLARQEERRRGDSGLMLESVCLLNGGLFPESFRPTLLQKLLLSRAGMLVSKLLTEHGFRASFSRVFGPNTQPSFDELAEFWQLIAYNGGADLAYRQMRYLKEREQYRERWVEVLQRTRVPLRFICGRLDPVSGTRMVERYRELVPNPDVVLLQGIGHYPQLEAPAELLQAYLEFLQRVTTRR
ncbi:MAG: alpha/beta hydrolase [Nevskia sp.]|nr:alpha/beta hydrolase [Nevskia sp.]